MGKNTHYPVAKKTAEGAIEFAGIFQGTWDEVQSLGSGLTVLKGAKSYAQACENVEQTLDKHKHALFATPILLYCYDEKTRRFIPQALTEEIETSQEIKNNQQMIEAAKRGDHVIIRRFLDRGAAINYQSEIREDHQKTVLHFICEQAQNDADVDFVRELLVDYGADPMIREKSDCCLTPAEKLFDLGWKKERLTEGKLLVRQKMLKYFPIVRTGLLEIKFDGDEKLEYLNFIARPKGNKGGGRGEHCAHIVSDQTIRDEIVEKFGLKMTCEELIQIMQKEAPEIVENVNPYHYSPNKIIVLKVLDQYYRQQSVGKDNLFIDTAEANQAFGFLSTLVATFKKQGYVDSKVNVKHFRYLRYLPELPLDVRKKRIEIATWTGCRTIEVLSNKHHAYSEAVNFLIEQQKNYCMAIRKDGFFLPVLVPENHLFFFKNHPKFNHFFCSAFCDTKQFELGLSRENIDDFYQFIIDYSGFTLEYLESLREVDEREESEASTSTSSEPVVENSTRKRAAEEALYEHRMPPLARHQPDPGSTSSSVLAKVPVFDVAMEPAMVDKPLGQEPSLRQ